MNNKYKYLNNVTGWMVWLFATIIYVMTMESSASFWDCGEFISSAFKQQVGHPPGAPLWLMIARIFSLFAGDNVENVAVMVNLFSALCSSFSILFLFWTITGLAKKIANKTGDLDAGKTLAILGSGVVGAAAYTFSDSFWFSAVEGEVYAASSFTTALVFWLLVKWEAMADQKYADRYLIIVAYVMGLSIGVHILNLLAIPALVYIYYFKRFKTSTKGIIYAGVLGVVILGVVQAVIISTMVKMASKFEVFFTNDLRMPFDTGMWIYFLLIGGLLVYGIIYTTKKRLPNFQNAIYAVLVILIGYSSFAMIVIRSAANPPMDENNPENIVNLLPYLNREQYGDRPLMRGQSFSSELDHEQSYTDGNPVYYQSTNKKGKDVYEVADERKNHKPKYSKKSTMYFPRMYSSQAHHVRSYKAWTSFKGNKTRVKVKTNENRKGWKNKWIRMPTISENMGFFFNYQINFMYWRYFMWNFAGRQNDKQGHGLGKDAVLNGNWLTGVDFIDNEHLGNQSTLPESLKKSPGRNTFYLLPFILGLIGMVFHFSKSWKDAGVVMLLFLMTGLAIVIYLNQTPTQPRERDYAYAGSFYAFAIWIGLGVQALFSFMTKPSKDELDEVEGKGIEEKLKTNGLYGISLSLMSLLGFGIAFTAGGILTVGYSFLYIAGVIIAAVLFCVFVGRMISSNVGKALVVIAMTLSVPYVMGSDGWDDHNRNDKYTARDFAKNYLATCELNAIIFTNGDNDTFPLWYVQDVEGFRTDVRVVNLSLLNTDWYIDQMKRKAYLSEKLPFSLTQDQYRQGTRDYVYMDKRWTGYQDLKTVMNFIKSDKKSTKLMLSNGGSIDFIPADSLSVKVDKQKVLDNGTVLPQFADQIPESLDWSIQGGHVLKAKLMILDLLANNDWERPIYFAITVGDDHYMNLEEYFQLEGLAYRVTPIKHQRSQTGETGWIHVNKMYDNLMNNYTWGNMEKPGVYMGEQVQRMSMNYRNNFARLAKTLVTDYGDTVRAVNILDRCMEIMPASKIPYSFFSIYMGDAYYKCGEFEKGNKIMFDILDKYTEEAIWFIDLEDDKQKLVNSELERAKQAIQYVGFFASKFQLTEVTDQVGKCMEEISAALKLEEDLKR
ncbi:MAG: hypothetical protein ACJAZ2_000618 [Glaciecola sp.]|jgi:hypothetical protein